MTFVIHVLVIINVMWTVPKQGKLPVHIKNHNLIYLQSLHKVLMDLQLPAAASLAPAQQWRRNTALPVGQRQHVDSCCTELPRWLGYTDTSRLFVHSVDLSSLGGHFHNMAANCGHLPWAMIGHSMSSATCKQRKSAILREYYGAKS